MEELVLSLGSSSLCRVVEVVPPQIELHGKESQGTVEYVPADPRSGAYKVSCQPLESETHITREGYVAITHKHKLSTKASLDTKPAFRRHDDTRGVSICVYGHCTKALGLFRRYAGAGAAGGTPYAIRRGVARVRTVYPSAGDATTTYKRSPK